MHNRGVPAGTRIIKSNLKSSKIEDIGNKDKLLSYDINGVYENYIVDIKNISTQKVNQVKVLKFESGRELRIGIEQSVFSTEGWVLPVVGTEVFRIGGKYDRVKSVKMLRGSFKLYDIDVVDASEEPDDNSNDGLYAEGYLIHNPDLEIYNEAKIGIGVTTGAFTINFLGRTGDGVLLFNEEIKATITNSDASTDIRVRMINSDEIVVEYHNFENSSILEEVVIFSSSENNFGKIKRYEISGDFEETADGYLKISKSIALNILFELELPPRTDIVLTRNGRFFCSSINEDRLEDNPTILSKIFGKDYSVNWKGEFEEVDGAQLMFQKSTSKIICNEFIEGFEEEYL